VKSGNVSADGACGSGVGGTAEWFGRQLWARSPVKRRWEEGLAAEGGAERERVLDMGEQQGSATNWKCKYCPFLQGWKACIQILKAVDSVVHSEVYGLSV